MKVTKPKPVKIPEKQIENAILDYLAALRVFAWKNQSVGVFDPTKKTFRKAFGKHQINGVSDILGIYRGHPLAIEVKARDGKLSEDQKPFLERVIQEGGLGIVARSIYDVSVIFALDRFIDMQAACATILSREKVKPKAKKKVKTVTSLP